VLAEAAFQRDHQEIIFPAALIDPVDKIAVKRHISIVDDKDSKYY
jgi:hypothetical protein